MTFEQELVKVIEHGCPFCGSNAVTVDSIGQIEYFGKYSTDSHRVEWVSNEVISPSEYDQDLCVACADCMEMLWATPEIWQDEGYDYTNWIPELEAVVGGTRLKEEE